MFLHYQKDGLLGRTVVLQNEWATQAVFRILDDEGVKARYGRFDETDCERLWHDSMYARMHPELLRLMQHFELCYELRDSQPPTWLAPQLLPPAKPKELADWGEPGDLVLRYRYGFLPKGMISRLTVRQHRFVRSEEKAWVTGVLFERDGTAVLVELLANGSEIELRGRGPDRKALLSVIAADLDALNESFPGLRDKVDQRVPCHCEQCRLAVEPEFFAQKDLLRHKEHNRLQVECPRSFEDVDVLELLDGIRMEKLSVWAKKEAEGYFSQDELYALRDLLIKAGFVNRQHLQFGSMDPQYMAMLPIEGTPGDRLVSVLDELNQTPVLTNGELPFRTFLNSAVENSKPLPAARKLQQYLDRLPEA